MEMKTCVLLTLLNLCCPLVLVAGDFEDFLGAMIIGSMIGKQNRCVEYGHECRNMKCCQYIGYSKMCCHRGQCLQARCGSYGMRCDMFNHCCYHENLTCFLATGTCGYVNNGIGRK